MATATPDRARGEEILRVTGLKKSFGSKRVLEGLDLTVRKGENLAILGQSGSGKSVLLRITCGLLEADQGEVRLWGQPIAGLGEEGWLPLRRRMGVVFQGGAIFDSMKVGENVAFPLRERKISPESEIRRIVGERLEWVNLPGVEDLSPSQLSGGMRRRVAIARTLAADPEFILYDEPTSGLDPINGRIISRLMRDLDRKLHSTSILVTHDLESACTVSSRWVYMSGGRILQDGAPEEFFLSPHEEIQELLAGGDPARYLQRREARPGATRATPDLSP